MATKIVIDISQWQTVNNWQQLSADVDGVILRLGYRGYETAKIVKDSKFDEFLKYVKKYNIPYGIYFVTQAITVEEAQQEAQFCLDHVKGVLNYPIFIDSENGDGEHASGRADRDKLNKTERTGILRAFCDYIHANSQYTGGIYASENWFINELNADALENYFTWVAKYSTNAPTVKYDAWQYTSTGVILGINGNVDVSHFIKQASFVMVDEIAKQVIAGEWGNGEERKERLDAAGYDYYLIQAKVNEMLAKPHKSNEEIAKEVMAGLWGNGADRKYMLEFNGYDYNEIQSLVNKMAAEQPKRKSNEEIAQEVVAGKWGNGQKRKEKLEAAGYNYYDVQDIVDRIIDG